MVARSSGSTFSILPMMCLLSRGKIRNSLQGPLTTSPLSPPEVLGLSPSVVVES